VNDLLKANEELTQERDAKLQELASVREKLAATQASEQKLEKELDEAQTKLQEVCFHSTDVFVCIGTTTVGTGGDWPLNF